MVTRFDASEHLYCPSLAGPAAPQGAYQAQGCSLVGTGGDPSAAAVTLAFSSPRRAFGSPITVRVEMRYRALVPFLNLAPRTLAGESVTLVEAWP